MHYQSNWFLILVITMYLVFKTVSDLQLGLVRRADQYLNYVVGFLDDSVKDIVPFEHLNAVIVDEPTAMAWKFAGNYSGYVSVRPNTLSNDQLAIISSSEAEINKVKYYLTDDDKANAIKFMKVVLRKILDEVYDSRFNQLNVAATNLETATWAQQYNEAAAYQADNSAAVPMLQYLAAARNITVAEMVQKVLAARTAYHADLATLLSKKQAIELEIKNCQTIPELNIVIHRRFGYDMPSNQKIDLNWEGSSTNDL
jgi:hypothetical protein